jgi:hypothetical protein
LQEQAEAGGGAPDALAIVRDGPSKDAGYREDRHDYSEARHASIVEWEGRRQELGHPPISVGSMGGGPVEDLCGNRPWTRWITPARLPVPEVLVLTG